MHCSVLKDKIFVMVVSHKQFSEIRLVCASDLFLFLASWILINKTICSKFVVNSNFLSQWATAISLWESQWENLSPGENGICSVSYHSLNCIYLVHGWTSFLGINVLYVLHPNAWASKTTLFLRFWRFSVSKIIHPQHRKTLIQKWKHHAKLCQMLWKSQERNLSHQ